MRGEVHIPRTVTEPGGSTSSEYGKGVGGLEICESPPLGTGDLDPPCHCVRLKPDRTRYLAPQRPRNESDTPINLSSSVSCLSILLSDFCKRTDLLNVFLHVPTASPLSSSNTFREVTEISLFYFSLSEASWLSAQAVEKGLREDPE